MKLISGLLVNTIIKLLEMISSSVNYRMRGLIASLFGLLIYSFSRKRKKITIDNLIGAFPDMPGSRIKEIVKNSFKNIAITYFELLAQRKIKGVQLKNQIKYENIQLIENAQNKGNGVILMSGHFGNWELLALSAGYFTGIPVLVVVQKQRFWDKQITESRTKLGNSVVERGSAARKLVTALRSNGTIALLADQSPPKIDGIFVDFFGKKTLTYKAPAELALKFGAPIITGFAVRNKDYTYTVRLEEVIHSDLEYNSEGISKLTQRYTTVLENRIREYPDMWAWQHRRWKNSPPPELIDD